MTEANNLAHSRFENYYNCLLCMTFHFDCPTIFVNHAVPSLSFVNTICRKRRDDFIHCLKVPSLRHCDMSMTYDVNRNCFWCECSCASLTWLTIHCVHLCCQDCLYVILTGCLCVSVCVTDCYPCCWLCCIKPL